MKFSKKGYLKNSPDVNKPQNIIKGGSITMKGVDFKVLGTDDRGYTKVMYPGNDYHFPNAKYVTETPIKNINMSSPFQKKFSAKSPLNPTPLRQEGFVETKFTDIDGEKIATRRELNVPGQERLTYEQVGVDPREGERYWKENPEKYKEYLESKKGKTIVQERAVDVNLRKTPGSFKPGKFFGLTLSPDMPDQLPMENIQNIYRKAFDLNKGNKSMQEAIQKDFNIYLKEAGYSRNGSTDKTVSTGKWTDVRTGN